MNEKDTLTKEKSDLPVKAKPRKRGKRIALVSGSIAVIALCFGAGYAGSYLANTSDTNSSIAPFGAVKDDGNKIVTKDEQTISAVAEKVGPSVVSIVTSLPSSRGGYVEQAAGTGIIVSKNGYVMTNKHVVSGASTATVVTADGTTYDDVKIVGSDPLNDLAFLKIPNVTNLKPATLGDSKTIRIGQAVIAIGNALGQYQNTVTSGIISGLGRPVVAASDETGSNAENLNDLIQTDAAINSGNSGGPLLNLKGQVIGINTAVASDAQSIGFAIPVGAAKGILKHLITSGKVERAVIGVQYLSITPEVKKKYNLSVSQGDYVISNSGSAVQANGPADKAGIKNKDIITKVNGVEIGPGRSVASLIGEFQPGDTVTLTVLRNNKARNIDVTLGAYGR